MTRSRKDRWTFHHKYWKFSDDSEYPCDEQGWVSGKLLPPVWKRKKDAECKSSSTLFVKLGPGKKEIDQEYGRIYFAVTWANQDLWGGEIEFEMYGLHGSKVVGWKPCAYKIGTKEHQ